MEEKWLPVVDYEGLYAVSSLGRLKSLPRVIHDTSGRTRHLKSRLFNNTPNASGYPVATLRKDKIARKHYIHHLVLEAFVGPCPPGLECRHLDGNSLNAALSNLCWGTSAENSADTAKHGTQQKGNNHWNSKLKEVDVIRIKQYFNEGKSNKEIAIIFGVHRRTIQDIRSGKTWIHVVLS